MEAKKKRLTLDMDPPLQRRLKAVAALRGVSMRRYCLTAIGKELAADEANGMVGLPLDRSDADRFEAIQEQYFGDSVLRGSSADLIREAREIRRVQLEDVV